MKIMLAIIAIAIPSMAMQQYSPNSLFNAVKAQDKEKVLTIISDNLAKKQLLNTMLEWQEPTTQRTALLQATIENHLECAEILINAGANIFANNWLGVSSFSHAFKFNQIVMIKAFMSTPKVPHKSRIEWWLFNQLKKADIQFSANQLADCMQQLFSCNATIISKYRWLADLARVSNKAGLLNAERLGYALAAPLYKTVAPLLIEHYHNQRGLLIKQFRESKPNYFNRMPSELCHLVINFLQEPVEMQQQHLTVIKQMPEN